MLTVLDGGGRRRTVWQALCAFAEWRLDELRRTVARDGLDDAERGLGISLEIWTQFFDLSLPELFPAPSRTPSSRRTARGRPLSRTLDAGWLAHGLAPCAALFPYQCLVGSAVIDRFEAELEALERFLRCTRVAVVDGRPTDPFEKSGARAGLARHRRIQRALEPPLFDLPRLEHRTIVDGRFRVERRDPGTIAVSVPGEKTYERVQLPASVAGEFVTGRDVCLAMTETPAGWVPLASTLPVAPAELDEILRSWERRLARDRPRPALAIVR